MRPTDHRVLFNGDCNFLFGSDYRPPGERHGPYTAKVLDDYVDLLADNGVDTFVINASGQVPWYPSRNLPSVLSGYTRGDRAFGRPHCPPLSDNFTQEQLDLRLDGQVVMLDRLLDLAEAGVDWVARLAVRCREREISPWVSLRMNDGHGANSWAGSYFNAPPQKKPDNRLSGIRLDPRRGIDEKMQLTNYEHAEVRDFYLGLARELIEDYDFDGIELDWMREPVCCEPPASQETIDVMTAWHGEIRALARQRSTTSGEPFFVGMRIPGRLGVFRTVGIDVAELARQDLIDFVEPTNTWQTTWDVPYDRMRAELGDSVAIYGVIEDAPNWMFCRSDDGDLEGYRRLSCSRNSCAATPPASSQRAPTASPCSTSSAPTTRAPSAPTSLAPRAMTRSPALPISTVCEVGPSITVCRRAAIAGRRVSSNVPSSCPPTWNRAAGTHSYSAPPPSRPSADGRSWYRW